MKKLTKLLNEDGILLPIVNDFFISSPDKLLSLTKSDLNIINKVLNVQANRSKKRKKDTTFHAGSSGYCMREQVLSILNKKTNSIDPKMVAIFIDGNWRNVNWVTVFNQMGILLDTEHTRYNKKYNISYTPDAEIDLSKYYPNKGGMERIGVEIKGMHEYEHGLFKRNSVYKNRSKWAYLRYMQVQSYMLASDANFWIIWGQNKNNQDYAEKIIKRDEKVIDIIKKRYTYMGKAMKRNVLPSIECGMNNKDSKFRYCKYSDSCVRLREADSLKPMVNREKFETRVLKKIIGK